MHVVVLAGEPGERFWQSSTEQRPKPFLHLWGDRTLFHDTLARAAEVVSADRVWVSTLRGYRDLVAAEFRDGAKADRLILEPTRRDTGGSMALAALRISVADPNAASWSQCLPITSWVIPPPLRESHIWRLHRPPCRAIGSAQ